jgi:hypothetical protein
MRCLGHVTCVGRKRGAYRVLMGICEGKRLLRRPKGKWGDYIKIIFKK